MSVTAIDHLIPGIQRYVDMHIETGAFLRAVLENDLRGASARGADMETCRALSELVVYLELNVPEQCWGSPEKVKAWLDFDHQQGGEPCV
jgi:hypothetical protein